MTIKTKDATERDLETEAEWAQKVEDLYRILRENHGVVDVKFAFGPMKGKEPRDVYKSVAAALKAVIDGKTTQFLGLNDSYGLVDDNRV